MGWDPRPISLSPHLHVAVDVATGGMAGVVTCFFTDVVAGAVMIMIFQRDWLFSSYEMGSRVGHTIFKLRRGALIGRSCMSVCRSVCPQFSDFSKILKYQKNLKN